MIFGALYAFMGGPVGAGFALTLLIVTLVSIATQRLYGRLDAIYVCLMFWGSFFASKFIAADLGAWTSVKLYPAADMACASIVTMLFIQAREKWKLAILFVYLTKCILHVTFWVADGRARGLGSNYQLSLNILFAIALLCILWPGGRAIVDLVVAHSRSGRGRHPGRLLPVAGRTNRSKEA